MSALLMLTFALKSLDAETKTYQVGSLERRADIYAPSKTSDHPPLVFGFHGHGGNSRSAARSFHIEREWPEAVVVYMEGLPSPGGKTDPEGKKNGWQLGKGTLGDRDLAFFDAVYEDVTKSFNVDLKRVYAMGHSNGGRFTYVLWAERGDKFAAFAPSGSPSIGFKLSPKPLFHIAGEQDPLVPFRGQKISVEVTRRRNGCPAEGEKTGEYTTLYKGSNGNDVVTYFHPGGHEYPTQIVPALIVDFFKSHPGKQSR